jgi:hypothetical protein
MTSHRSPIDLPSPLPWFLDRGVQTGGLWEVLGRSPEKTSRLETPINTGVSEEYGRSDGFSVVPSFFSHSVVLFFLFLVRWEFTLSKLGLSLGETPTFLRGNLQILERISEKGATFLIETRHLSRTLD